MFKHNTAQWHVSGLAALLALATAVVPVMITSAYGPAQTGAPTACKIDGQALNPPTGNWMWAANFDQALSATKVKGCMAMRDAAGTVHYLVAEYCTVMNNTAGKQFGNGLAQFDGNAFLRCAINVPPPFNPPSFWVHARAKFSTSIQTVTNTLIASNPITFTAQTNPACQMTLNSTYNDIAFASATGMSGCAAFVQIDSNVVQSVQPAQGVHWVGANAFGPTLDAGNFVLPATYTFDIGAAGQMFSLDWIMFDPGGGGRCCGPQ